MDLAIVIAAPDVVGSTPVALWWIGGALALGWSLVLAITDLRSWRLPNRWTLPAAAIVCLGVVATGRSLDLWGGAAWWLACVLPGVLSPRLQVGGGDAKLAVSLGTIAVACGGVAGWIFAVSGASAFTLLLSVVTCRFTSARQRAGSPQLTVAHGPGMLFATWMSVILTMWHS